MKKLFALLLIIPTITEAQSIGPSYGFELFKLLFIFGIFLLIFLALRKVLLWYWKVDVIIKNQENQINAQQRTNTLLTEYIDILKNKNQ